MALHETKETLGPEPLCPVDPTSMYFWLNLALLPRNEDENMPRKSRICSTFMLIAAQKMSRFFPWYGRCRNIHFHSILFYSSGRSHSWDDLSTGDMQMNGTSEQRPVRSWESTQSLPKDLNATKPSSSPQSSQSTSPISNEQCSSQNNNDPLRKITHQIAPASDASSEENK